MNVRYKPSDNHGHGATRHSREGVKKASYIDNRVNTRVPRLDGQEGQKREQAAPRRRAQRRRRPEETAVTMCNKGRYGGLGEGKVTALPVDTASATATHSVYFK